MDSLTKWAMAERHKQMRDTSRPEGTEAFIRRRRGGMVAAGPRQEDWWAGRGLKVRASAPPGSLHNQLSLFGINTASVGAWTGTLLFVQVEFWRVGGASFPPASKTHFCSTRQQQDDAQIGRRSVGSPFCFVVAWKSMHSYAMSCL